MTKRIDHRKAAVDELKKAALDAGSTAIPELGKARGIAGTIYHTTKAAKHATEAVRKTVKSKTRELKRVLRDPLKLKQQKRRRKSKTKTRRKKTPRVRR